VKLDHSVYPDLETPPDDLRTPEEKADYVHRICGAFDFGIFPERDDWTSYLEIPDRDTIQIFWKMLQRCYQAVGLRGHYAAVWRSLYRWFVRTQGAPAADIYAAAAMGAASFFQLLAIGWIVQMTGLFDIGYLLRDRKFLVVVVVLFLMVAHFCVARSIENKPSDRTRLIASANAVSPRLGLMYLASSALAYLLAVFAALWLRWR
jgi:hypothetical protein